MADGVDQKVRMDVRLIDMRCDQHLAVRPGPGGELLCQFVCLLWSDVLIRMEGLRVVINQTGLSLWCDSRVATNSWKVICGVQLIPLMRC